MQTSMERVRLGVEYSNQAGGSLRQIVDSVVYIAEMSREIAVATGELAHTSEEINGDIIAIERSLKRLSGGRINRQRIRNALQLSLELKSEISRFTFSEQQDHPAPSAALQQREKQSFTRSTTAVRMKTLTA